MNLIDDRFVEYKDIACYSDDTLIFGTHTHSINKLLHAIQKESEYYNLQLNYDKCINLTMHQHQSSIKFLDGSLVPRKRKQYTWARFSLTVSITIEKFAIDWQLPPLHVTD